MGGRGVYSLSMKSGGTNNVEYHSLKTVHSPVLVERRKVVDYLLKKRERDDKSGYFIDILGYNPDEPEVLARDLIQGFATAKYVKDLPGFNGKIKSIYEMELGIKTRIPTITVWETVDGSDFRLITAYPKKRGKNERR